MVLLGSLAHGACFVPDSDVDRVVEGLAGEDDAEEIIGDRSVDLIELETARGSLRRAVERYGAELWLKGGGKW